MLNLFKDSSIGADVNFSNGVRANNMAVNGVGCGIDNNRARVAPF